MNEIRLSNNESKTANSSTFLKSHNENGGSNKFIPFSSNTGISSGNMMNKTINNGSTTSSSFISPMHNKSLNSDMIKSSIQEMNNR